MVAWLTAPYIPNWLILPRINRNVWLLGKQLTTINEYKWQKSSNRLHHLNNNKWFMSNSLRYELIDMPLTLIKELIADESVAFLTNGFHHSKEEKRISNEGQIMSPFDMHHEPVMSLSRHLFDILDMIYIIFSFSYIFIGRSNCLWRITDMPFGDLFWRTAAIFEHAHRTFVGIFKSFAVNFHCSIRLSSLSWNKFTCMMCVLTVMWRR